MNNQHFLYHEIAIRKAIIFNALLFFSLNIKAQGRDYVITNTNDTLKCKFISYGKYKVDGNDKPKSVNVDEIKEYYLFRDNVINRAVYLPGHRRPQFAKVIEKGKLNLYEQISHYVSVNPVPNGMINNYSITEWYIAKGTDTVKILKNSDFLLGAIFLKSKTSRKNDLAEMLRACLNFVQ